MTPHRVVLAYFLSVSLFLTAFAATAGEGFGAGDAIAFTQVSEQTVSFTEVEGKNVVLRLTPIDSEGNELGSGRVVVIRRFETRTVRLADEFTPEELYARDVRIEVLQGGGRVDVRPPLQIATNAVAGARRRLVARPVPLPPSTVLIDQAEAAGAINSETALLYRVYALFTDARLPAQYRGNDSAVMNSLYLGEVRERFAGLSLATQLLLQPFLTPPAYQDSWANPTSTSHGITASPPPCQFLAAKWSWVDTANEKVRVWYRKDLSDLDLASKLVNTIDDKVWPALSGLMKTHVPLADDTQKCNGGNGRLDIYLSDVSRSMTAPFLSCKLSPVFIILQRTDEDMFSAHEIFHAFQYGFPLASCIGGKDYRWWAEASAHWIEDFVFPIRPVQIEQLAAPNFLTMPDKPLDYVDDKHEYGAYLLPFYVHRRTGSADFVRVAWEKSEKQPALEALDATLAGGFEAVWPEFVRYNWNREPFDDYLKWDKLAHQATPAGGSALDVSLGGRMDAAQKLKIDLPRLSATYKHFKFTDDTTRTVAFWNGVTSDLKLTAGPAGDLRYEPASASGDAIKGAHVQALIKMRGKEWTKADWTHVPYITYCRDVVEERIDELVLIISNSEFKERDRKLQPPGLEPVLWASNMGCWRWTGTSESTLTSPGGSEGQLKVTTTVTWTRVPQSQTVPSITYVADGTHSWKVTGPQCNANGTLPMGGASTMSTLSTYNFIPSEGELHRTYAGAGGNNQLIPISCGNASTAFTLGSWFMSPMQPLFPGIPDARFVRVSASGTTMQDTHQMSVAGASWSWNLKAEREP